MRFLNLSLLVLVLSVITYSIVNTATCHYYFKDIGHFTMQAQNCASCPGFPPGMPNWRLGKCE